MDLPAASPSDRPQAYEQLTEDGIKRVLIECRGDIFVGAQMLGITAMRLNRAIKVSTTLQTTLDTIEAAGKGLSEKQLEQAVQERLALYRVVGLDALHDLAAMPIDENSAQNQVKLAAAARLVDGLHGGGSSSEVESIFRELRESYQKEAPRLRVIRERTTVETIPGGRILDANSDE